MTTSFARGMERKARDIAELMEDAVPTWKREVNGGSNVKPFYSPYRLFEPHPGGVDRVLIGVNPGGDPKRPDTTTGPGYTDFLESSEPLNSFLDECWNGRRPGKANMQIGIANVFKSLYGVDEWESALRSTSTFNVCPLRTRYASDIPPPVWIESVRWCLELLVELRPSTIVCFAVLDKKDYPAPKSPWHAIEGAFGADIRFHEDVSRSGSKWPAFVYAGRIHGGELRDCEVVGIPHISHNWNNQRLFAALRNYAASESA